MNTAGQLSLSVPGSIPMNARSMNGLPSHLRKFVSLAASNAPVSFVKASVSAGTYGGF